MSTASSGKLFLITPDDDNELPFVTKGVSFSTGGALAVVDESGITITIPSGALVAGIVHPIRVRKVLSTGTTAASIVGYA